MVQDPEIVGRERLAELKYYFATEYGFLAEKQIQDTVIYRRVDQHNVVERVVVKFPKGDRWQEELDVEAGVLVKQWGSEHNCRILAVSHIEYGKYREPWNRHHSNPPPILPWRLRTDPQVYGKTLDFSFIVIEYLARGTGCVRVPIVALDYTIWIGRSRYRPGK
ncbi:hypothetical protein F5B22DRAFT_660307 [Xylaria bambusicola]|uniref:uncharacterized protein n=1 Tax=Xylaria bambusicola TaxID=326684 RepID=UPI002007CB1E|nr:uncharacterized protein F5B22DRAFT_660307 [Xylaria bambusicola]KAI0506373.1 hypothetical protein F5B22DRAFT_660307 [Xylaria bambusicola]